MSDLISQLTCGHELTRQADLVQHLPSADTDDSLSDLTTGNIRIPPSVHYAGSQHHPYRIRTRIRSLTIGLVSTADTTNEAALQLIDHRVIVQ